MIPGHTLLFLIPESPQSPLREKEQEVMLRNYTNISGVTPAAVWFLIDGSLSENYATIHAFETISVKRRP